jgi:hypothetical protein
MYMEFGGTDFGFYSGANGGGNGVSHYIMSYDYNSPLGVDNGVTANHATPDCRYRLSTA